MENKKSCVFPLCQYKGTIKLFKFPANWTLKKAWLDVCNLENVKPYDKICYLHFDDDAMYISKNGLHLLRTGSIPKKSVSCIN